MNDLAPIAVDKTAAGKGVAARLDGVIRKDRIMTDPLMTYAYSGDASSYRLVPAVVVIVNTEDEVRAVIEAARAERLPLTIRGTANTFEATFRAVQRGIMRPSRETLFTVVPRADRYKAKAFIDTFVYRAGDVVGAQTEGLLGRLGLGLAALASCAVPLAAVWLALGLWLGRAQSRRAPA